MSAANKGSDQLAEMLHAVLVSPNVSDANGEAANVVDVINQVAEALWGGLTRREPNKDRASTITLHGDATKEAAEMVRDGLYAVSRSLDGVARAIRERGAS